MRFAGLMLVALSISSGFEDVRVVGLVISTKGEWVDNAGKSVYKGYAVWNNSILRPKQSSPGAAQPSLEVRSYVNGEKISLGCDNPPCGGPVDLSKVLYRKESPGSFFAAISAVVSDLIGKEEVHSVAGYTRPLSKGLGGQLSDGVVAMDTDGLDLSPVFRGLSSSKVELEFCPVAKDGSSNCSTGGRQNWEWEPDHPAKLAISGLKPGLYEIGAYSQEQTGLAPVRLSAMMLIVRRSDFDQASRQYEDAVQQTKSWSRGEQSTARRLFLQYLQLELGKSRDTQ